MSSFLFKHLNFHQGNASKALIYKTRKKVLVQILLLSLRTGRILALLYMTKVVSFLLKIVFSNQVNIFFPYDSSHTLRVESSVSVVMV